MSLGIHESQSRLWENLVGRSRPFCDWVLPTLRQQLGPALGSIDGEGLYRAVNSVQRSLIRVDADETTYNLHIILRFELELALIEGTLEVDDLPQAWNEGMQRLLGVEVTDDANGVLQDVHWGAGPVRLLPDLHAREPDRRPALDSARGRHARRSTRSSAAASSRRCASGSASTSTATAASSRRASCCTG